MNPSDDIDEAVQAGIEAGYSNRRIAADLDVERGRVNRVVTRLKKRERAAAAATQEAEDPSSLEKLISDCDDRIATSIAVGNALEAGRLTRVREGLISQRPVEVVREDDGSDWNRLTETERSAMHALLAKLYDLDRDDAALWWERAFASVCLYADEIHPAHIPLEGSPESRLIVPGNP